MDRIRAEGGMPRQEIVSWRFEGSPLPKVGDAVVLPDGRPGRVLTAKPADDLRDTKLTVRTMARTPYGEEA